MRTPSPTAELRLPLTRAPSVRLDRRYRGGGGPLHVSRGKTNHPLHRAFIEAGQQAGYPFTDDMNGYQQEGLGWMDMTVHKGRKTRLFNHKPYISMDGVALPAVPLGSTRGSNSLTLIFNFFLHPTFCQQLKLVILKYDLLVHLKICP